MLFVYLRCASYNLCCGFVAWQVWSVKAQHTTGWWSGLFAKTSGIALSYPLTADQRYVKDYAATQGAKQDFIKVLGHLCHCVLSGAAWLAQCRFKHLTNWGKQGLWWHQDKRNKNGAASDILIKLKPVTYFPLLGNGVLNNNTIIHILDNIS